MNSINQAIQNIAKDSMLQKIESIAFTYSTTDGEIKSYSFADVDANKYVLVGMVDVLREEVMRLHIQFDEDEDEDG